MTLRRPIRALPSDLDKFLSAKVGEEIDGVPLSVVSTFARLGLDPWEEAGRLSVFNRHEAAEQLARPIAETPGRPRLSQRPGNSLGPWWFFFRTPTPHRQSRLESKFDLITSDSRHS